MSVCVEAAHAEDLRSEHDPECTRAHTHTTAHIHKHTHAYIKHAYIACMLPCSGRPCPAVCCPALPGTALPCPAPYTAVPLICHCYAPSTCSIHVLYCHALVPNCLGLGLRVAVFRCLASGLPRLARQRRVTRHRCTPP